MNEDLKADYEHKTILVRELTAKVEEQGRELRILRAERDLAQHDAVALLHALSYKPIAADLFQRVEEYSKSIHTVRALEPGQVTYLETSIVNEPPDPFCALRKMKLEEDILDRHVTAADLLKFLEGSLVGRMIMTAKMGSYPGGPARVTQITPDRHATDIILYVSNPAWKKGEDIGVFEYEYVKLLPQEKESHT